MREQLLGYLLGALEDTEREQVEAALKVNRDLQRELELLSQGLEPLRLLPADYPPPPYLTERTCQFIAAFSIQSLAGAPLPGQRDGVGLPPDKASSGRVPQDPTPLPASFHTEPPGPSARWSAADIMVVFGVFLCASVLFVPAVVHSRTNSRLLACQNNLRELGVALVKYSQLDPDGFFPSLWNNGELGKAGLYATKLTQAGLLESPSTLLCPATPQAAEPAQYHVPTAQELAQARGASLANLQATMGGSYGYNLGYVEDGTYHSIRNQSRPHYALMSDAPSLHLEGRRSNNHGSCGQNVLYEDGHAGYLNHCFRPEQADHIFLNGEGVMAAGLHSNDVVIGHSAASPLPGFPVVSPTTRPVKQLLGR